MSEPHHRKFGFLIDPISGEFEGGAIKPLEDHSKRLEWFQKRSNRDGFYYPPEAATYHVDPKTMEQKQKVERSERPASVYALPASHILSLELPLDVSSTTCSDDALIIYLLAYLHGTRLQFADWHFEGRVPHKSTNNIFFYPEVCFHFLGHTYQWWRSATPEIRTRLINILYVLTRARSLEWDWDAFSHQYMVFDAIYNLHMALNPTSAKAQSHRTRFDVLLSAYGIPCDEDLVNKLYKARNELFHEAMWTGSSIGFGSPQRYAYYYPHHLARLNSRLICGLVDYKNGYAGSVWWAMGTFAFDLPHGS
jgi:hypothetical protein